MSVERWCSWPEKTRAAWSPPPPKRLETQLQTQLEAAEPIKTDLVQRLEPLMAPVWRYLGAATLHGYDEPGEA